MGGRGCAGRSGVKGGNGTNVIAKSIKYIFKKLYIILSFGNLINLKE